VSWADLNSWTRTIDDITGLKVKAVCSAAAITGSTHLFVKKRFGKRHPAFDSHYESHATRIQAKEPPQNADSARPHSLFGIRPSDVHEHMDHPADKHNEIVDGQASQHEDVFLVAA
jgi:hypothetical protein